MKFKGDYKYVYLIKSTYLENLQYKIGVSSKPNNRIKQLKTSNPNQLEIVKTFYSKYPYLVETALKNNFKTHQIAGEWFDLNILQIERFEEMCQLYEKNFKIIHNTSTLY